MTDIGERLRERAQKRENEGALGDAYHFFEAAAEITRLREQLAAADELAERKDTILNRVVSWVGDDLSAYMPMAEAAISAAEKTCQDEGLLFGFPTVRGKHALVEAMARALHAAVLAEREACAQVALATYDHEVDMEDYDCYEPCEVGRVEANTAMSFIAAAIRARSDTADPAKADAEGGLER